MSKGKGRRVDGGRREFGGDEGEHDDVRVRMQHNAMITIGRARTVSHPI